MFEIARHFCTRKKPREKSPTKLLQVSSWNHHAACRCRPKVWLKRKACCNRVVEKKRLLCWVVVWNMFYVYSYFGEMEHICQMGWFNHQPVYVMMCFCCFSIPVSFLLYKTPKGWNIFFGCVPSTKKNTDLWRSLNMKLGNVWVTPSTGWAPSPVINGVIYIYIYAPISRVKQIQENPCIFGHFQGL